MATSISTAFIKQFEAEVHLAYQRMGSKLMNTVRRSNNVKGNQVTFQKMGKGAAVTKTTHADVPTMNITHSNVTATLNILEWARGLECPVVFAGSSSSNGDKFANPYTLSKSMSEQLVELYNKVYDLPTTICRFYNVYGPHQLTEGKYCTLIGIFETLYKEGRPLTITGDGEQRRDFTHVDDIVDGLIRCGESIQDVSGELFELGRGKNYSVNEIARAFGENYPAVYVDGKKGEMRETLCDTKPAYDIIGYKPKMNLEKYIKDLVETEIIKRGYDF